MTVVRLRSSLQEELNDALRTLIEQPTPDKLRQIFTKLTRLHLHNRKNAITRYAQWTIDTGKIEI